MSALRLLRISGISYYRQRPVFSCASPSMRSPRKKKGAIGVRGMKLGDGDQVENVYYTKNAVETTIEYKGKELILNNLKLGKRDSKGTKVRV